MVHLARIALTSSIRVIPGVLATRVPQRQDLPGQRRDPRGQRQDLLVNGETCVVNGETYLVNGKTCVVCGETCVVYDENTVNNDGGYDGEKRRGHASSWQAKEL